MTADLFALEGRVVIVTGSARGNGAALARGFLSKGALVAGVDLLTQSHSEEFPDQFLGLEVDVSQPDAAKDIVEAVVHRWDTLDVLVNNAGVSLSGQDPYADDIWHQTFRVNLEAVWRLSRVAAIQMIRQRRGSIINITSLGAMRGFPGNPAYQASKAALRQLTLAMARDFGKDGVRVNNLCPGYIHTSMTSKSFSDPELHQDRLSHMLLDRWGEPEDLVGPCLFLASDAARYVTGVDLPVDGGWLAKGL